MTRLPWLRYSADESVAFLTRMLEQREPFYFAKHGDGAIQCIYGYGTQTRDGEQYSAELGRALANSIGATLGHPTVWLGDWMTATFDSLETGKYPREYHDLISQKHEQFLHFCCLLLRKSVPLVNFYRAVLGDPRRKLYMGPAEMRCVADQLGCSFLEVPMRRLYRYIPEVTSQLLSKDFDVLLYGAGLAGHIAVTDCWRKHPERTYINLGSALDPIGFNRKTRQDQPSPAECRQILTGIQ